MHLLPTGIFYYKFKTFFPLFIVLYMGLVVGEKLCIPKTQWQIFILTQWQIFILTQWQIVLSSDNMF